MSIWTRRKLLEQIALWKGAYKAAISGKSYTIGQRSLTWRDLPEIVSELKRLQNELEVLAGQPTGLHYFEARMVR